MNAIISAVMLLDPAQLALVIVLSVLFVALVVGNILLCLYLRNRGTRKLCTHQLQSKRDELLQQLETLQSGGVIEFDDDEAVEEETEMLIVDEETDDDEDDDVEERASAQMDAHSFGVVAQEEVDESMEAEILYVERTSKEVREKLGFADKEYDKKRYYVRYSLGFEARLLSSTDEVKERYIALRNELALYRDVKVKGSYRQQRIFKGRKTLGLLMFRGKTLCIALALNPADYEETKFRGIDKSASKRFEKTPMMMKLTSQRKLDYVKYLLVQLAEDNTILLESEPELLTFDLGEKSRDELYLDNKLQIIVLGEVPESVPYEQEETYDEEIDEEDDDEGVSVEELTRYNRSYTARIIQADDEMKARYSEIKNHLVSYHGVFNSITWNREAFYVSKRDCIATFAVRGKTLCLFLAVPASRFDGTKYKVEDRTQKVRNAKMPSMFRIKSDRGTKYAKELIDIVLAEKGVKLNEDYKPVNYRPAYRSTDNLIRNGYIRVKTTQIAVEEQSKPKETKKTPTSKSKKTSASKTQTKKRSSTSAKANGAADKTAESKVASTTAE